MSASKFDFGSIIIMLLILSIAIVDWRKGSDNRILDIQELGMSVQKQSSRGVLRKSYSENMQQIYRRTPMAKCAFNKVGQTLLKNLSVECL